MDTYSILIKAKLDPCRTVDIVKKEYNVDGDFCTVNGQYADVTLEVSKYLKPKIPFIKGDIWVVRSDDCEKFYTNDKNGDFFRFAFIPKFSEIEYYTKASFYRMIREKTQKIKNSKKISKFKKSRLDALICRMERFADETVYCDIAEPINCLKEELLKGGRVVQIVYVNLNDYGL